MNFFLTLLLFLLITISTPILITNGCFEVERQALLSFKADLNDPGKLMFSWHGQHCCNWSGVTCDKSSEHIVKLKLGNPYSIYSYPYNYSDWASHALTGKINPALLSLEHLTHLDLNNHNFSDLRIPSFIASFENLVYLNLSSSEFQGNIPFELGNLSQLQYLDLSNCYLNGSIPAQLGNLSDLHYLNLGDNNYYEVINDVSWLFRLSNLRHLDMSSINLNNTFDWSAINKMDQLETLILVDCDLSEIPIDLSHANLTHLTKLDLSDNSFHVTLSNWLWNLTSLSHLDLTWSYFLGNIPHDMRNLAILNYLAIGWNNLEHIQLETISNLHNLRTLDLSSSGIEGNIVNFIKRLGPMWYSLEKVYLYGNNLSGNISSWIAQMKNLSSIDLRSNSLSGHITSDIGTLAQLKKIYLSNNSLSGVITEAHFANLSNLVGLDLSDNMIIVKLNDNWVPPFHLEYLSLSSCRVGPMFPSWLREQRQLLWVELSNTSINDVLPTWFWNLPLEIVDLSYNNISGNLPTPFLLSMIWSLNLRSNNLSGLMPTIHGPMIEALDLSENQISGSIPYNICEMTHLYLLILSNNTISGEIPICWKNISSLEYIDLSNNKITGELPFSIGSLKYLIILQLYNNHLHGEIPSSLQQCKYLSFLSLGKNNFSGKIPTWMGTQLQSLAVLQLRSNKFSGFIPPEFGKLSRLQILDLADNSLTSHIPNSFGNFSSMKNSTRSFESSAASEINYEVALYIDINGQQVYTSKPLDYAKTIDISGNNIIGYIPDDMWLLEGVINLNFSKNHLIGGIPEIVGAMRSLESLDLSYNNLSGILPQALSVISSLHNLNLSYNNFSGKIPTGRQLDTLSDPSIYAGNPYLCGPLIDKNCSEDHVSISTYSAHSDNRSGEMVLFYLVLALDFSLGFWSIWGVLIFQNTWKVAYFRMVDRFFDKIYVHTMLAVRRLG